MSSASLREFDRLLSAGLTTDFLSRGFTFGRRRTFRRTVNHQGTQTTQIVEFQIGNRSLAGRFTVNLAVYNPEFLPVDALPANQEPESVDCIREFLTQRLGFLRQPRPGVLDRLRRRSAQPYDHWWAHEVDPSVLRGELADVAATLSMRGFGWLDGRTSIQGLEWARRQIDRRKAWMASAGSLGATSPFTPEPLPTIA